MTSTCLGLSFQGPGAWLGEKEFCTGKQVHLWILRIPTPPFERLYLAGRSQFQIVSKNILGDECKNFVGERERRHD